MSDKKIPKSVIERIPTYLDFLKQIDLNDNQTISSTSLAQALGLGEVQVRKDLNIIAGNGKPKIGYNMKDLINKIKSIIRSNEYTNVIVVGVGHIGQALANYQGFYEKGFIIKGLFDNNKDKIGKVINNNTIKSYEELGGFCINEKVDLAIIAVPLENAQNVCDDLIKYGVKGILNFTNCILNTEHDIKVRNIDIASMLTKLSIEINN